MKKQITLLFALLFSFAANLLSQKEARQQLNFDFDWTFSLTDSERYITQPFVKGECVEVQLPHQLIQMHDKVHQSIVVLVLHRDKQRILFHLH